MVIDLVPTHHHRRTQQHGQTLPMFLQISLGQFHPDRKHSDRNNNPSNLQRDLIDQLVVLFMLSPPMMRVEEVDRVRA